MLFKQSQASENTIYVTGGKPVISDVTIGYNNDEPNYYNPFSEKCLDNANSVILHYNLSEESDVTVDVYSLNTGNLKKANIVRTISEKNVEKGNHIIIWNGRNEQGTYVEEGEYRLAIKASDYHGNTSMIRYAVVKLTY